MCPPIVQQWTSAEGERVLLKRAKELATRRVEAAELLYDDAKRVGTLQQIEDANKVVQAALQLEQTAVMNLQMNTLVEYNLAAQANQYGCVLTVS